MNRFTLVSPLALMFALAGATHADVLVSQFGGKLKIKGDAQNNAVALEGQGAIGELAVQVEGVLATTFIGVVDIEVALGDGDDTLELNAIQIGGSVKAKFGNGADRARVTDDGTAVDVTLLIAKDIEFSMGNDLGDVVEVDQEETSSIIVGRNLTIRGAAHIDLDGNGGSSDSEVTDVNVGGNLRIKSSVAAAAGSNPHSIDIDDLNVGGATKIELGAGVDDVEITDAHFARRFELKLGNGDDRIGFGNDTIEFNASAVFDGGSGSDEFLDVDVPVFAVAPTFKKLEVVPALP